MTTEDLARMARRYLTPQNMTISLLWPKDSSSAETRPNETAIRALVEKIAAERAISEAEQGLSRQRDGVWTSTLANGLRLVVRENHAVPTVAVRVAMLGGILTETPELNGIAEFTAGMLTRGTESRSAFQIAKDIEGIAGSLDGFAGRNTIGASGDVLAKDLDKGLELLADILLHPAFGQDEIERERRDLLAAIARREDDLARFAFENFAASLYERHPYRLPQLGTAETVGSVKRENLVNYLERHRVPENIVVSVVGDVDPKTVLAKIDSAFGGLAAAPFRREKSPTESPLEKPRVKTVHRTREQAHLVLGFPGTTVRSDDRFALEVLNTILSGQGGRLFIELRDKQSLAYSVTSLSVEGYDPGYFAVYMG
ncbi:MAG: M16 family metallopeptidase, partial [Vicinamibacteria bacterium]